MMKEFIKIQLILFLFNHIIIEILITKEKIAKIRRD